MKLKKEHTHFHTWARIRLLHSFTHGCSCNTSMVLHHKQKYRSFSSSNAHHIYLSITVKTVKIITYYNKFILYKVSFLDLMDLVLKSASSHVFLRSCWECRWLVRPSEQSWNVLPLPLSRSKDGGIRSHHQNCPLFRPSSRFSSAGVPVGQRGTNYFNK